MNRANDILLDHACAAWLILFDECDEARPFHVSRPDSARIMVVKGSLDSAGKAQSGGPDPSQPRSF
jgi:hypothetical protein